MKHGFAQFIVLHQLGRQALVRAQHARQAGAGGKLHAKDAVAPARFEQWHDGLVLAAIVTVFRLVPRRRFQLGGEAVIEAARTQARRQRVGLLDLGAQLHIDIRAAPAFKAQLPQATVARQVRAAEFEVRHQPFRPRRKRRGHVAIGLQLQAQLAVGARPHGHAVVGHWRADGTQVHDAVEQHVAARLLLRVKIDAADAAIVVAQRCPQAVLEPDRRGHTRRAAHMLDHVSERRHVGTDAGEAMAGRQDQHAVELRHQLGAPGAVGQVRFGQQAAIVGVQRQPAFRGGQPGVQDGLARIERQQRGRAGAELGGKEFVFARWRHGQRGIGLRMLFAHALVRQLQGHAGLAQAGRASRWHIADGLRAERRHPRRGN